MWSSTLPVDLVVSMTPPPHPFPAREPVTVEVKPEPVKVTKCPPWTEEDEKHKTFPYQWGYSARQRAAIPAFNLDYYDERK